MFIEFKSLQVENFMPYESFSVLFDSGKTVIKGKNHDEFSSNGAGKSTIFDSLFWGLFNRLLRDGSHPEATSSKSPVSVSIELMVDGTYFKLVRQRKSGKNTLQIFNEDGKDVSLGTITMSQSYLEAMLALTPETFLATTLFDGSTHTSFATMTDSNQKKLFTDILQLDFWDKCVDKTKVKITEVNNVVAQIKRDLGYQEVTLKNMQDIYQSKQQELKDLQEPSRESFQATVDLKSARKQIKEMETKIDQLTARREILMASEAVAKQAQNEIALIESEIRSVDLKKIQLQKDIKQIEDKIKHLETGVCPECRQTVKGAKEEVEKLAKTCHSKIMEVQKVNKQLVDLTEKVSLMKDSNGKHDWTLVGKCSRELAELQYAKQQLEAELKAAETVEANYQRALDRYKIQHEAIQADILKYNAQGKAAWDTVRGLSLQLKEKETDLEALSFLLKMFGKSGIQTSLIRGIEEPLNRVLHEFTGMFGFKQTKVELSTFTQLASGEIRDKISVFLLNGKNRRDFKSFSQGEKRRLDLVFFLALREVLSARVSTNLIVFDEVINNLDPTGVESLKTCIESNFKNSCVWIAIPTDYFEWSFNNQWTAVKRGGVSCLEK